MLEQRIEKHFIDSADLKYQAAQALAKPIAQASEALLACVTNGGKLLVCGNGVSAATAQQLAATFMGRYERERPELAAIALSSDGALLTALANDFDARQVFAKQVRALGASVDVLLAISVGGQCANVIAAIEVAQEREMIVIALTGQSNDKIGGTIAAMLIETDIHICVPHDNAARVQEVHLLALHCLCDGVDALLLGDQENL